MNQNHAGFDDQHNEVDAADVGQRRGRGLLLVDWLNGHLTAALGPPPIGPYGDVRATIEGVCPVCAHPMSEHTIDHSTRNAVLNCPVGHPGQFDRIETTPLNEVGMPKR